MHSFCIWCSSDQRVGRNSWWSCCELDQTGIHYVPVSDWTMEKTGAKIVDSKRQITAVFAWTMNGTFLPPQLIYQGRMPFTSPRWCPFWLRYNLYRKYWACCWTNNLAAIIGNWLLCFNKLTIITLPAFYWSFLSDHSPSNLAGITAP